METIGYQYSPKNQALAAQQCIVKGIPLGRIGTARMWQEAGRTVKQGETPLTLYQPITFNSGTTEETVRIIPRSVWFVESQTRELLPGEVATMPSTSKKSTKPKSTAIRAQVRSSEPKPVTVKATKKSTTPKYNKPVTIVKEIEPVETTYTRPESTIMACDYALAKVNRREIVNALKMLVRGTKGNRIPLPVLHNVLIKIHDIAVELVTTDMQAVQVAWVEATGTEQGAFTVNCDSLLKFLQPLKEHSVTLEYKDKKLNITCGMAHFNLATMESEDFPILPELPRKATHRTDAASFVAAINQVIPSAATDDSRPVLSGVLLDIQSGNCSMISADGFRLNMVKNVAISGPDGKYIVPAKCLKLLPTNSTGKLEITVASDEAQLRFGFKNIDITTRLIADVFPNYNQIIPIHPEHSIEFQVAPLLTALRSARPLVKESASVIRFIANNGELVVSGNAAEIGNVDVYRQACDWPDDAKIAVNVDYAIDTLQACGSPAITMEIQSASSPCVFKTGNFTSVIMPMHLAGGR